MSRQDAANSLLSRFSAFDIREPGVAEALRRAPLVTQDGAETMGFALVASLHPNAISTGIGSVWEAMVAACNSCC